MGRSEEDDALRVRLQLREIKKTSSLEGKAPRRAPPFPELPWGGSPRDLPRRDVSADRHADIHRGGAL